LLESPELQREWREAKEQLNYDNGKRHQHQILDTGLTGEVEDLFRQYFALTSLN
jgi:hypothetical protein